MTAAQIFDIVLKVSGLIGLTFAYFQLRTRARAHLFSVYKESLEMLDEPGFREARQWVASIVSPAKIYDVQHENWLALTEEPVSSQEGQVASAEPSAQESSPRLDYWKHKQKAERVARMFDRLGLLVREGRVPANLIARFYVRPTLVSWFKLAPYIEAVRRQREQPGHMWEFENLVFAVVIEGVRSDSGVWYGCKRHDNLFIRFIDENGTTRGLDLLTMRRPDYGDRQYLPGTHLWELDLDSPFGGAA